MSVFDFRESQALAALASAILGSLILSGCPDDLAVGSSGPASSGPVSTTTSGTSGGAGSDSIGSIGDSGGADSTAGTGGGGGSGGPPLPPAMTLDCSQEYLNDFGDQSQLDFDVVESTVEVDLWVECPDLLEAGLG